MIKALCVHCSKSADDSKIVNQSLKSLQESKEFVRFIDMKVTMCEYKTVYAIIYEAYDKE